MAEQASKSAKLEAAKLLIGAIVFGFCVKDCHASATIDHYNPFSGGFLRALDAEAVEQQQEPLLQSPSAQQRCDAYGRLVEAFGTLSYERDLAKTYSAERDRWCATARAWSEAEAMLRAVRSAYPTFVHAAPIYQELYTCVLGDDDHPVWQSPRCQKCFDTECDQCAVRASGKALNERGVCTDAYLAAMAPARALREPAAEAITQLNGCSADVWGAVVSLVDSLDKVSVGETIQAGAPPLVSIHHAMDDCARRLFRCDASGYPKDIPCSPKLLAAALFDRRDWNGQAYPDLVLKTADGGIVNLSSLKVEALF